MSAYGFSNREDAKLLLLSTEEKNNLQRDDMTFYALINYFRKLLEFFWSVTFRHKLKHTLVGVPNKMVLLKFESILRDERY